MFRNSSTYLYLAVFLGLVCYLTFIDKKIPGTKDQEDSENQLFKLEPEEVTSLEIKNVHGLYIFKKTNNHWEIKSPVNTLADGSVIDGVIAQIAAAQPQRIIKVDGSDTDMAHMKEWGLSDPAERVVIHNDKNQQYILLVGRKTAISDSVYARASERKTEPVRIIPLTVKEALQKDLSDFRSRNIFEFEAESVTKIATHIADTATTPGQQCEIVRKDGKWTMQMPLVARASAVDVQALLSKVLGEHIVDFVTDDASNLSQYGLTSPSATMTISLKPDEELVLEIGGPVPGKPDQVYAQRLKSNSVFTLTRASVDDLFKAVPNVRDRHILAFDPGKATGVAFSYNNHKGGAEKDAHGLWKTEGGDVEGRADVARVTDLLSRLSQLETTPVLKDSATDLKPFGLDKPSGKITIDSPELKSPLTLYIGKVENKLLYVRNSIEPFVYTIPDNALDFLPADNLALLDLRAVQLTLKDVREMKITAGAAPAVVLSRSSGGTWSAANVKDRMVDSMKAETQASLFCGLVAAKWLGPVLPAYGLSKPELVISVEVADKAKPTTLRVGAKLPDGNRAAQIEGESIAFELNDADYGILNASTLQPIPSVLSATNAPSSNAPSTNAPAHAPEKKK